MMRARWQRRDALWTLGGDVCGIKCQMACLVNSCLTRLAGESYSRQFHATPANLGLAKRASRCEVKELLMLTLRLTSPTRGDPGSKSEDGGASAAPSPAKDTHAPPSTCAGRASGAI